MNQLGWPQMLLLGSQTGQFLHYTWYSVVNFTVISLPVILKMDFCSLQRHKYHIRLY